MKLLTALLGGVADGFPYDLGLLANRFPNLFRALSDFARRAANGMTDFLGIVGDAIVVGLRNLRSRSG